MQRNLENTKKIDVFPQISQQSSLLSFCRGKPEFQPKTKDEGRILLGTVVGMKKGQGSFRVLTFEYW